MELKLTATFETEDKLSHKTCEEFINAIEKHKLLFGGPTNTKDKTFIIDGVLTHMDEHAMNEKELRHSWSKAAQELGLKLKTLHYDYELSEYLEDN